MIQWVVFAHLVGSAVKVLRKVIQSFVDDVGLLIYNFFIATLRALQCFRAQVLLSLCLTEFQCKITHKVDLFDLCLLFIATDNLMRLQQTNFGVWKQYTNLSSQY